MGMKINLRSVLAIIIVSTILANTAETKPAVDDKSPLKGYGNDIKINKLKHKNDIVLLKKEIYETLGLIIFIFRRGQTIFEERVRCAARFKLRHLLPRQCYYL